MKSYHIRWIEYHEVVIDAEDEENAYFLASMEDPEKTRVSSTVLSMKVRNEKIDYPYSLS